VAIQESEQNIEYWYKAENQVTRKIPSSVEKIKGCATASFILSSKLSKGSAIPRSTIMKVDDWSHG
jgi:hypothetical protein